MRSLLAKPGNWIRGAGLHIFNVSRPLESTAGCIHLPSRDRPVDGPSYSQAIDRALTFQDRQDTRLPSASSRAPGWGWWAGCIFALFHRVGATSDSKGIGGTGENESVMAGKGRDMACCSGRTKFWGEQAWFGSGMQGTGGWRRKEFQRGFTIWVLT